MKRISTILGLCAVVLLVGAGCASGTAPGGTDLPAAKNAAPKESQKDSRGDVVQKTTRNQEATANFTLSGQAVGDRSARFEWEVPEDIAEKADKYVVVRDTEANPEYPASWWWWRGPVYRALEWKELPLGEAHFRVCAQVEEECIAYSNDIVLDIE